MEKKKLSDFTTEELIKSKKALTGILIIMSILIIFYIAFYVYKLMTGTWDRNNTLSIVMVGLLVVVIVMNRARTAAIDNELKKRNAS